MHNFLVLGGTFTNRRHCEKEKKEEKMRSEFDRDCEIGMLEENVLPLGSGLRAPIRGALGIILGHKTAGLNIFVGASKFLLHHVEEGLLNQRLLENVVTCDLKVWLFQLQLHRFDYILGHNYLIIFDFI